MARCEASASSIMGVIGTEGVMDKSGVCGSDAGCMGGLARVEHSCNLAIFLFMWR